MGYNIYYMFNVINQEGYIGQNKDTDNEKRILDHVDCFVKGTDIESDGAARLIRDMGGISSSLRHKFFFSNTNGRYGIPLEVYNNFFEYWSLDGKTSMDSLSEEEILDLAEMFHIIAAGLQNRNWNKYNTRPGGFDSSKRLTYHFSASEAQKINSLKKKLANIRTEFDVTNFSVDLRRKPDDWKKIVFPIGHVVTTAILDDKIKNLLSDEFWFSLINSTSLQKDLTSVLAKWVKQLDWIMPETWGKNILRVSGSKKIKKNAKDSFSEAIKNVFRNHIKKEETRDLIEKTVKKVFRNEGLNFKWEFSDQSLDRFIKEFNSRLSDFSLNMWGNLLSLYDTKHEKFTGSLFSKNGQGVSLIKFNLPHIMADFQWNTGNDLPLWASILKNTPLTDSFEDTEKSKLKQQICTIICKELFPIITSTKGEPPSTNFLIFRVFRKASDKQKGYNKEFFNILLTAWHQYTYGPNAWITRAEHLGISEDGARANFIANRTLINNLDKVYWYSGKAWEPYRLRIQGIGEQSLEQSGRLLAELWKW